MPVAPFFTLTTYYCAWNYWHVHSQSHLDPEWGKKKIPWHYDHHMNTNQDANWGVTKPWFDYIMGTRVISSADLQESNPLGIKLNAGALYYNTAIEMNKQMNSLPLEKEKEYESLKVERNKLYTKALPYFESAHRIDPTSTDCMLALKEIYVRLEQKDKAEEMKQKLGN